MSRKYSRFSTAPRAAGHQALLILAALLFCLLGLTTATHGKGLNASHFTADDCLGARIAGGNTRYTPNFDLYSNIGPDLFGWNLLQNHSLDEVFLKITFKAGVTPSASKLVDIRYGDEFVFTPGDHGFFSRVVGQDLLVWYGFQNRGDFGRTIVTSDNSWTFTVAGDFPVVGVYAFISYHSNTAGDMPDLLPLSESRLYLLPDDTAQLYAEKPTDPVPRKPLVSAQKLIVLVHGWNPQGYLNKFAPDDSGKLSGRWAELASTLVVNPIIQQFGWTIARYDWSRDAATGATFPWQAADAAMAHGAKLGQLVQASGATHVQFIAHSAGNWAARRAAAYLRLRNPSIQIQITSLDPFVTDSLQPAFELTSLWTDYRDNFYVVDWNTDRDIGIGGLDWTSGDFAGWSNDNIEVLDPYFESWMIDHSGPVSWYAVTATEAALRSPGLISFDDGFPSSLPVRLASAGIDNFLGQRLIGDSGSVGWFTYQATAQSSEPAHGIDTPARRSVWGNWTAPANGTVTFDTFGADFYDVLAAYTGSSIGSLKPVARDYSGGKGPGQCEITFTASAGQTYYIAVDGILGAAGQSPLHWRMSGGAPTPTLTITAPAANATVSRVATVSASASSATKVEFYLDGVLQFTDAATPFAWAWNTTTATSGSHTISAKSYSGTTLLVTSANRTVTVNNSVTPPPDCPDANEPNNSSLTATPLAPNFSLDGYICSATDVDWYKVTVTEPGTLSLNLTVPALNDYDIEIYGPDSTFRQGSYQNLGQAETVALSVPSPGTYYARVYGYPAGNGSFNAAQAYKLTSSFAGTSAAQSGNVLGWGAQALPVLQPGTRFVAMAGGSGHSLALKTDGTVVAWGWNTYGQSSVPVGLRGVIAVAAGQSHSLALKADGTVVAWGWNGHGQCTVPSELRGVIAIAAGAAHSLALKSDGTVVAWGIDAYGQNTVPSGLRGVIAIAEGYSHSLALKSDGTVVAWGEVQNGPFPGPATVPTGLSGVVAIAAGYSHSLALKSDGTVEAWGSDAFGQGPVPSGLNSVIAIAEGYSHCLALKSDGTIVAWGRISNGEPATVPTGLSGVIAIAAGYSQLLALKSDGTVAAWGLNGQSTVPSRLGGVIAIAAGGSHGLALRSDGTVAVWGTIWWGPDGGAKPATVPSGLMAVIAIAAGDFHSLVLTDDGAVVAWGYNFVGQTTVPSGLRGVIAISAGGLHSLALKSDGTVVAWGQDQNGPFPEPATVPTGLSGVIAIAAGYSHSLALKSDGTVVAWGANGDGQCTVPVGLRGVTAVAGGGSHSLALKSDGTVVAWGANGDGQCTVPVGLRGVIAIAAGASHGLALKSDGAVAAWGLNTSGQSTVPSGLGGVIAIVATGNDSLAIVADRRMDTGPSVLAQPLSRTVSLGQAVSFAVSVNGTPPFTYQWRHNGTDVAGATAATLTLPGVNADDAGGYSVVVADAFGTATSTVATLTVLPAPPLADYPTSIAASISGNRLTLSWPTTHLGWILQTQTSSLNTGITSIWVDIPGSGSSTTKSILLSPASPASFFRLRYP